MLDILKKRMDELAEIDPKTRIEYASKKSNRSFDLLLRYPYERKFNNPELVFTMSEVN